MREERGGGGGGASLVRKSRGMGGCNHLEGALELRLLAQERRLALELRHLGADRAVDGAAEAFEAAACSRVKKRREGG